ncbi:MAG: TetR/AcrR family transcriptional regulator [Alphaproteobacteria bacterium]|nr:TetR/AcrR family transcriptional regulator [Alphaproteobacteria bacterium]
MPTSAHTRPQTDSRRGQLLELGLQLFGSRPYDDVSIDDIAREAGISKGLLYHYFGGKRDFYVAVVAEASARLRAATEPDPALDPRSRIVAGLGAYLDFVDARAAAFTALMRGGLGTDPEIAGVIDSTRQVFVDRFVEGLGLTAPRPVFRTAVRAWIGAVEAASLDWITHRDLPRDTLLMLLLSSLGAHLVVASRLDPAAGVVLTDVEPLLGQLGL